MFKQMFLDETISYARYTEDANRLDLEVSNALTPIVERYLAEGFSPRDVSHVICLTAWDLETGNILDRRYKDA